VSTKDSSDGAARAGERPWKILGIHHVAFAHGDAGPGDALADLLGLQCEHAEVADGFDEAMVPVGDSALQLLSATGPGVITTFLERRGPGLHHVALRVDDVTSITQDLCARGVEMVDRVPRAGGAGTLIAFAHPRAFGGMLVEFVEDRQ
jgi:methylmalonyl-CoA/ethylmalonyl-CoA epimerase